MAVVTKFSRRSGVGIGLALAVIFGVSIIPWSHQQPRAAADIQISTEQFGRYFADWSEPEGFFDSDNFISNETSYLHVVDQLHQQVKPGGIYIGVGPDQNFSYIVHTKPSLAIIPDIRRQNALEHLLFKALFSMASNRIEYLSLLFSKQAPSLKVNVPLENLFEALRSSPSNEGLFRKNLATIEDLLREQYKLNLTTDDLAKIEYTYETFWKENLDLRFSTIGRNNAMTYPTLGEMLLETDRQGLQQSYLSSEELFQWMKRFQAENRLIPIVGDFAGSHAFRTVSRFLRENGLHVSAFYTSNVEFYLFGRAAWSRYVANVHTLPLSEDAVFIRSYFPTYGRNHPLNLPGHRSTSLMQPITPFLDDYDAGGIRTYWDIVKP